MRDIARRDGLCNHYAGRLLPLAFLAPELTELILEGRQPAALSLSALMAEPLPLDWPGQRSRFEAIG